MLKAASYTKARRWKPPQCPSMDEWIIKMSQSPKIDYYSAMKRNEGLTHGITWVILQNTVLSKRSQTQR